MAILLTLFTNAPSAAAMPDETADRLLYDAADGVDSTLGNRWRFVTDAVMGGVSRGGMELSRSREIPCLALSGRVSLENNGGFIQMALDLDGGSGPLDAREFAGLRLLVQGNGEEYGLHLRTPDLFLPWQSYRGSFRAGPEWQEVRLPFASFKPYRTARPLATGRLSRLGVIAIGRAFEADLCVARVSLYLD